MEPIGQVVGVVGVIEFLERRATNPSHLIGVVSVMLFAAAGVLLLVVAVRSSEDCDPIAEACTATLSSPSQGAPQGGSEGLGQSIEDSPKSDPLVVPNDQSADRSPTHDQSMGSTSDDTDDEGDDSGRENTDNEGDVLAADGPLIVNTSGSYESKPGRSKVEASKPTATSDRSKERRSKSPTRSELEQNTKQASGNAKKYNGQARPTTTLAPRAQSRSKSNGVEALQGRDLRSAPTTTVAPTTTAAPATTAAPTTTVAPKTSAPAPSARVQTPTPRPAAGELGSCRNAPALPPPSGNVVRVANEPDLQAALRAAASGTTILIAPGTYKLTETLQVRRANITIRGDSKRCDAVVLQGHGMDNPNYGNVPHGIFTDAANTAVQNLTITDVYYHAITVNHGADSPRFYNLMLLDSGEQHLKSNSGPSWGNGTDNGVVDYLTIGYPNGTPKTDHGPGTGYVQGVDVHGGANWVIKNSYFFNFHTRDSDDHLWSPAILMWTGSKNTVIQNNDFVNTNRAIALGLVDDPNGPSHSGGRVSGNRISIAKGLLSPARTADSDAAIIIWDSPGTTVENNKCSVNANLKLCIEFRYNTTGAVARNNSVDAPIASRAGAPFTETGTVRQ